MTGTYLCKIMLLFIGHTQFRLGLWPIASHRLEIGLFTPLTLTRLNISSGT
jgi:hypothetical protein